MTTGLKISGTLFSRTISLNEIEKIKKEEKIPELKRVWDKVADWFCGTDKKTAQKALFNLIKNSDARAKIEAFNQLKSMVSPAFKEAFTCTVTKVSDAEFSVNLSIAALLSTGEISTTGKTVNLSEHITAFTPECINARDIHLEQLKKDIPRSEIYLCHDENGHQRFTEEMLYELFDKISEEQRKSLNVALSQIGIIDIKNQINKNRKDMSILGDPGKKLFIFTANREDISIEVHIFNNFDIDTHRIYQEISPESRYPSLYAKAHIHINNSGICDITAITISHPGVE